MIRLATLDDTAALIALADAIGLFPPHELAELGDMLADYFAGNLGSDPSGSPATMAGWWGSRTTRRSG